MFPMHEIGSNTRYFYPISFNILNKFATTSKTINSVPNKEKEGTEKLSI